MNIRILNREGKLPADGWHEIETPGEHLNRTARVVQVLDAPAFETIANRFATAAAAENFAGLLIDEDHFSLFPEKSSAAKGWLMQVRNRDGHLEGRIDWTPAGLRAIEDKEYKFFSTVYETENVERIGERTIKNRNYPAVRPLQLDRLALTNDPSNKGGKPISNRDPGASADASTNEKKTMKTLLKQLGLAEDASEESAVAAFSKIQNRASLVEVLTAERDALLASVVEADLEKYAPVIKNRDTVKAQLLANRKGTLELLESMQLPAPEKAAPERITNRGAARTPAAGPAAEEANTAAAETRAAKIANRAREIQATSRHTERPLSYSQAFNEAERETPATV